MPTRRLSTWLRTSALAVFLAASAALVSCAGGGAVAGPSSPAVEANLGDDEGALAPGPHFAARGWKSIALPEWGLKLPLPESKHWQRDRRAVSWAVLDHPGRSTRLLVRRWETRLPATRPLCEAEARLTQDLPLREGSDLVQQTRVERPAGFDTEVELRTRPWPDADAVEGFALAVGARGKRCFVFVATTRAEGPEAAGIVGTRLGDLLSRTLGGLEDYSALDVPRERPR